MKTQLLIGTFLSTVGLAAPVWAQDAPKPNEAGAPTNATPAQQAATATAPADEEPGEIVITAQKRSERLQDVPIAVTVLSGAALESTNRPSIETASQLVPSLNFLKSGTTLNQTIFLRGVGTATFSIAGEPSVSTVVDGVVYSRSGEAFSDLIDIDQMEVLRGPQGTLFGKNASAGVINITTKAPTATPGGTVEASYFDRNEYRVRGSVNVPLSKELLSRFTAFYGDYDGNIRNVTVGRWVNGYRHYGGRMQLLYRPENGHVRLMLIGDYHHNNDDCCGEVIGTGPLTGAGVAIASPVQAVLPTPYGDKTRQIAQNLITRTRETGWGLSGQIDVDVGDHTLTSITAYRKWNNTEIRDGDFLPQAYVGFNELHDVGPQHSDTVSEEVRLTSPANKRLSYVLGGYYSRAKSERIFTRNDVVCTAAAGAPAGVLIPCGSANANPSTFPSATADFGSTFNNFALFGQGVFKLTEQLRLLGGLRYTIDRLSVFHSRNTQLAGPGIQPSFPVTATGTGQPATPFTSSTRSENLSGKASIQYDFNRAVMAYASYTRGYKGPAYNVFFNLTATGTNVIAPEKSDSFEAGLKTTLDGGRLVFNIAGFYAKYRNFQANNPDLVAGVVVTRFTNAGTVSTRGVELDMYWRPVSGLTFSGGVAYTDAHVDAFLQAPGAPVTAIIPAGTPLGFAPHWKGSLAGDYHLRTGGPVDVYLGASGNAQTKQLALFSPNADQRRLATIKGYAIVNLSAGIGDSADRYRLTFQVRNLFDTSYAAAIQNGGPAGSYRYQIPRDADRYYGVTARVNF